MKTFDRPHRASRAACAIVLAMAGATMTTPGLAGAAPAASADTRSPEVKLIDEYNYWFIVQGAYQGSLSAMRAGLPRYITDRTVLHEAESLPWGGTMVGYDGWARLGRISGPIWGKVQNALTMSGGQYYQQGNIVIHEITFSMAGTKTTPDPFVMSIMEKYTVENGRITRIDEFYSDTAGFLKRLKLLGALPQ